MRASALRAGADLHRKPIPLVAGACVGDRRQAARPADAPVPGRGRVAREGQQRRRGHARAGRRAARCRSRRRPGTRRDDPLAFTIGGSRGPALRPRQGRGSRRPLADRRLGQHQRALVLQRHRDVRRHRRRGARSRHPRPAVGRAPGARRGHGRVRDTGRRWSIRTGARSPANSSSAAAPASVPRTGCSSCPGCRAGPVGCSARSPGCSTTADSTHPRSAALLDDG